MTRRSQAFVWVDPQYAIFSASTRHHLPRPSVIERYRDNGLRILLRTDEDRRNDNDHIVCFPDSARRIQCNYADVLEENGWPAFVSGPEDSCPGSFIKSRLYPTTPDLLHTGWGKLMAKNWGKVIGQSGRVWPSRLQRV